MYIFSYLPCTYDLLFFKKNPKLFQRFYGYIFCKPSRDLTHPLEGIKGFKGPVAYVKCNRDFYESELGSYDSFSFVLLEDEQKIGVGYLLGTNLSYLRCLYRLILARIVALCLRFLLVLFTFAGNKFNRASAVKMTKRGTKGEKKAARRRLDGGRNDGHHPPLQSWPRVGDG